MSTILPSALAFARRNHRVFPVTFPIHHRGKVICSCGSVLRGRECSSPAKHPLGRLAPNGVLSASTDADVINSWYADEPSANLGVCTDKLVVVDVDPRHGGDESFRALEVEHGEMPPTWAVCTGGGGMHYLFAAPEGVEIKNVVAGQMDNPPLGRGIDIRAHGGYIVAPPSRHISGRVYAWSVDHHPTDVELAPAPDWLVARLATRTPTTADNATPPKVWRAFTEKTIREYRDIAACSVAGHLLRHWVDPYLVKGLLYAWSQTYCDPPLTDHELRQILNRIAKREDQRRDALDGGNNAA